MAENISLSIDKIKHETELPNTRHAKWFYWFNHPLLRQNECFFFLLSNSFTERQRSSLEDYNRNIQFKTNRIDLTFGIIVNFFGIITICFGIIANYVFALE